MNNLFLKRPVGFSSVQKSGFAYLMMRNVRFTIESATRRLRGALVFAREYSVQGGEACAMKTTRSARSQEVSQRASVVPFQDIDLGGGVISEMNIHRVNERLEF